mgnify:CR=1 FL=1
MQVVEVLALAAPDVVPQYGMYLRALSGEGMDVFIVSLAVLGGVVVFGARAVGIVAVYGIGFRAGYLYAAPLFACRAVACLGCAAGSSVQLAGAVGAVCPVSALELGACMVKSAFFTKPLVPSYSA